MPLADISEVDSDYWFEASGLKASVRGVVEHMRLVREVDLGHPILLDPAGRLLDGMHQVAKALLEGQSHIDAIRLDALPPPDFERCDPTDLPYDR